MDQFFRFRKKSKKCFATMRFTVGAFALVAAQVVDADLLLAALEGAALALVDVHALGAIVLKAGFTRG